MRSPASAMVADGIPPAQTGMPAISAQAFPRSTAAGAHALHQASPVLLAEGVRHVKAILSVLHVVQALG